MKVLLAALNAKFIHSSLALAYLDSFCQSGDWKIEKREYTINELTTHILADIFRQNPDILCFSVYIWNVEAILEICADYKKIAPHTLIVLGGPEVSFNAAEIMEKNPAVDCIIRGEGEYTLQELLANKSAGKDFSGIQGLTYRTSGQIVENPARDLIYDLDIIPSPYNKNSLEKYRNRTIYYETSRGCPYNCSYCLSSTLKGVRYFSLERVKKDLRFLMSARIKEVKFVDRTFNCHEKRAMEIMRFIIEENIKTKFHFEICADLISEEMLEFLEEIPPGVFDFEIGIQSTFPAALQAVNRQMNWAKLSRNIRLLASCGKIHLHLDLIAGLPYEDYATFVHSFNDVYSLSPQVIQLGFLKLLKGSKIRNEAKSHAYLYQEKPPYQVLANKYLTYEELVRLTEIEDLLDRYYNSGVFSCTLNYIIDRFYQHDAFSFFEYFAGYWLKNNLFGVGHKKGKEYTYLLDFMILNYNDSGFIINELLKFDFLFNHSSVSLPAGIKSYNPADNDLLYAYLKDDSFIKRHLPAWAGSSTREIRRAVHLELFHWDFQNMNLTDTLIPILFVYDPVAKKARQFIQLNP